MEKAGRNLPRFARRICPLIVQVIDLPYRKTPLFPSWRVKSAPCFSPFAEFTFVLKAPAITWIVCVTAYEA